jgi:hypothetical protein
MLPYEVTHVDRKWNSSENNATPDRQLYWLPPRPLLYPWRNSD